MEGHDFESFYQIGNLEFLIFTPEEFPIFQTSHQDFFVSFDDIVDVLVISVTDRDEVGQKLASLIPHHKVALVVFHGCDENFFWHFQVFGIKGAHEGSWILDQVENFIKEVLVNLNAHILFVLDSLDLLDNHILTLCGIGDNKLCTQVCLVRICTSNLSFFSEETMTAAAAS